MNNDFIRTILSKTDLILNDIPYYFPELIPDVDKFITWEDIEFCMNNPLFSFEVVGPDSRKIDIPVKNTKWNGTVYDKVALFNFLKQGNGLVCTNYANYCKVTNELLKDFESAFDVDSSIHVYYGLGDGGSFKIHADFPPNFIIQCAGETHWKIFAERQSVLNDLAFFNPKESELTTVIDVIMKPGDVLYIPARAWHIAMPSGPRLSLSIPCWPRFPEYPYQKVDRNYYQIFD